MSFLTASRSSKFSGRSARSFWCCYQSVKHPKSATAKCENSEMPQQVLLPAMRRWETPFLILFHTPSFFLHHFSLLITRRAEIRGVDQCSLWSVGCLNSCQEQVLKDVYCEAAMPGTTEFILLQMLWMHMKWVWGCFYYAYKTNRRSQIMFVSQNIGFVTPFSIQLEVPAKMCWTITS